MGPPVRLVAWVKTVKPSPPAARELLTAARDAAAGSNSFAGRCRPRATSAAPTGRLRDGPAQLPDSTPRVPEPWPAPPVPGQHRGAAVLRRPDVTAWPPARSSAPRPPRCADLPPH